MYVRERVNECREAVFYSALIGHWVRKALFFKRSPLTVHNVPLSLTLCGRGRWADAWLWGKTYVKGLAVSEVSARV